MGSFRLLLVCALGFLGSSVLGVAGEERARSGDESRDASRLTVDLKDGSRLVGTPTQSPLKIASESFGEVEVPISLVRSIELASDGTRLTLTTSNGERLRGAPRTTALELDTLLGEVSLPFEQVTRVATTAQPLPSAVAASGAVRDGYYLLNFAKNGVSVQRDAVLNLLIKEDRAQCVSSSNPDYVGMSGRIRSSGNTGFAIRFPHGTQYWSFSSGDRATITEVPDRGERQVAIRVADESLKEAERLNELLRRER